MTRPKFSIGVDLGTSNSVLAYSSLSDDRHSEVLAIPQWDTPATVVDAVTVPSFLYLPEEAIAALMRARDFGSGAWAVGRLAKRKASETPGRVVQSAKSWLCLHAADRTAPFLPWLSETVAEQDRISPVAASALILAHLRAAWNDRFAEQGAGFAFDAQNITITVPASFDAAAQRLTLLAAQQAGFPDRVRLLEEPQAAFYAWLEQKAGADPWSALPDPGPAPRHILVIDIGGGTSDFSLFELRRRVGRSEPDITRVAVSDHILLGGDNIDLAIAHLAETRRHISQPWDSSCLAPRFTPDQKTSPADARQKSLRGVAPVRLERSGVRGGADPLFARRPRRRRPAPGSAERVALENRRQTREMRRPSCQDGPHQERGAGPARGTLEFLWRCRSARTHPERIRKYAFRPHGTSRRIEFERLEPIIKLGPSHSTVEKRRKMPTSGPRVTTDCVVSDETGRIALIRRRNDPFKNSYALPGGFVEAGETVESACIRE